MRHTFGALLVAILLLAGGDVFRRAAAFEDTLSAAQERLVTENPAFAQDPEDAERAGTWVASLPVVGLSIKADLRRLHALAAYWRGDYAALQAPEAAGEPVDAVIRLVAANAMFRDLVRQPRDNQALGRLLGAVVDAYTSVLEADPTEVDAAYNREFVSRLRALIAAGRSTSIALPSRSDVHGEEGAPPKETTPREFNILVPLRPEERQEQTPQGGSTPQRKG